MEMVEQAGERSKSFARGKRRGLRHFFGTPASFCHFERRNVSKCGQQAIALAILYPEPEKEGAGRKAQTLKNL